MDPATLIGLVGIVIAAATSAWLVPLYFREKRAAEARFADLSLRLEKAQASLSGVSASIPKLEESLSGVSASIPKLRDEILKGIVFPAAPAVPSPAQVAEAVLVAFAEAESQAAESRGARHFDDPEAAREARAAREDKADREAATEAQILATLTEQVGDAIAPAIMGYVQANAPKAWKRALANPGLASNIIGPFISIAKRAAQSAGKGGGRSDMR